MTLCTDNLYSNNEIIANMCFLLSEYTYLNMWHCSKCRFCAYLGFSVDKFSTGCWFRFDLAFSYLWSVNSRPQTVAKTCVVDAYNNLNARKLISVSCTGQVSLQQAMDSPVFACDHTTGREVGGPGRSWRYGQHTYLFWPNVGALVWHLMAEYVTFLHFKKFRFYNCETVNPLFLFYHLFFFFFWC